jgi:uncharacterized YccA/Bax inhibitor family protein
MRDAATDEASGAVVPLLFALLCFAIAGPALLVAFAAAQRLVGRNHPTAARCRRVLQGGAVVLHPRLWFTSTLAGFHMASSRSQGWRGEAE